MNQRTPIGQVLAELGCVDDSAREKAAKQAPEQPTRFASRLLAMGAAAESELVRGLASQKGVPGVDLSKSVVDTKVLDLVPREIAQDSLFLPVASVDGRAVLAMANPDDQALLDELEFVTGEKIVPHVALQGSLRESIGAAYAARDTGEGFWAGKAADDSAGEHLEVLTGASAGEPALEEDEELLVISVGLDEDEEVGIDIEPEGGAGSAEGEGAGRRVLVVDDEEEIRNLLSTALVGAGYKVETAGKGLEALKKVKSFNPDALILDAMLPEVHGFEICRKVRSSKRFAHVPVLMISAVYRGWRYAQDVKEVYGATDFIEKPFRLPEVLARLNEALDGAPEAEQAPAEARQKASAAYKRGIGMLKVGKIEGAIKAFEEGLGADPFAAALHFSLGRALQVKADIYGSIASYERAIELDPAMFLALRSLAGLYENKGFRHKAIEMWERALPIAPDEETKQLARTNLLLLLEAPLKSGG